MSRRFRKLFDCIAALRASDLTSRQLQRQAKISRNTANIILRTLHDSKLVRPNGFGGSVSPDTNGGQRPILWHWTGGVE